MLPLGFGAFIGERRRGIDLEGFSLAEFVDRPEDTVTRHTHEDAHFWFVLEGAYISSAAGLDGAWTAQLGSHRWPSRAPTHAGVSNRNGSGSMPTIAAPPIRASEAVQS